MKAVSVGVTWIALLPLAGCGPYYGGHGYPGYSSYQAVPSSSHRHHDHGPYRPAPRVESRPSPPAARPFPSAPSRSAADARKREADRPAAADPGRQNQDGMARAKAQASRR